MSTEQTNITDVVETKESDKILKYLSKDTLPTDYEQKPNLDKSIIIAKVDIMLDSMIEEYEDGGRDDTNKALDACGRSQIKGLTVVSDNFDTFNKDFIENDEVVPTQETGDMISDLRLKSKLLGILKKIKSTTNSGDYETGHKYAGKVLGIMREHGYSENLIGETVYDSGNSLSTQVSGTAKTHFGTIHAALGLLVGAKEAKEKAINYHKDEMKKAVSGTLTDSGRDIRTSIDTISDSTTLEESMKILGEVTNKTYTGVEVIALNTAYQKKDTKMIGEIVSSLEGKNSTKGIGYDKN